MINKLGSEELQMYLLAMEIRALWLLFFIGSWI